MYGSSIQHPLLTHVPDINLRTHPTKQIIDLSSLTLLKSTPEHGPVGIETMLGIMVNAYVEYICMEHMHRIYAYRIYAWNIHDMHGINTCMDEARRL